VPTEADIDPDVLKRPCFVRALVRSRKAFGAATGLGGREEAGIRLPIERIPREYFEQVQSRLRSFLQPAYLPTTWEDLELYRLVACAFKTISETNKEVPTLVRQEPDCNVELPELKNGDAILGAWAVNGIDVLPVLAYSDEPLRGAGVRLRLHGEPRITFRFVSQEERYAPGADYWPQDAIDKPKLLELLTTVFRFPFQTVDDFVVLGGGSEVEGVRVFMGAIQSRAWSERGKVGREVPGPAWHHDCKFLVTDSNPQYFCVGLTFPVDSEDRKEGPAP
jgi:hypothetical protein